jgi:DNA-binding Lrp family transcriptional regulator
MDGYLFLNCSSGMVWEITDEVKTIKGVKMAHVVTGNFDVVAYAEFVNIDDLARIIEEVQSLKGVQKTQTAVAIPQRPK